MKADGRPMLKLSHVDTHYGPIQILRDVNVEINAGEITCLLGGNASGKSTTLRTVIGMVRPSNGTIEFNGEQIDGLNTQQLVERGISMVPENRRIFGRMTVQENLEMGAFIRTDDFHQRLEEVYRLLPDLAGRRRDNAGALSGGQRQMLALARALMLDPVLLLLDEPSAGLAPNLVNSVFEKILGINRAGVAIVLVEQNAREALGLSNWGYVLASGQNQLEDRGENLLKNPEVIKLYLGG